jgi:translation elongation factor EF-G
MRHPNCDFHRTEFMIDQAKIRNIGIIAHIDSG